MSGTTTIVWHPTTISGTTTAAPSGIVGAIIGWSGIVSASIAPSGIVSASIAPSGIVGAIITPSGFASASIAPSGIVGTIAPSGIVGVAPSGIVATTSTFVGACAFVFAFWIPHPTSPHGCLVVNSLYKSHLTCNSWTDQDLYNGLVQ